MNLSPGARSSLPVLLFLCVGFAVPLIAVIWFSFMPERSFLLTGVPSLGNYRTIFEGTNYISFLWSLGLAAACVLVLAVIGCVVVVAMPMSWSQPLMNSLSAGSSSDSERSA